MIEKEFHLPTRIRRGLFPDASLITFTGETRGESIHGWTKGKAGNTASGARGPGLCAERRWVTVASEGSTELQAQLLTGGCSWQDRPARTEGTVCNMLSGVGSQGEEIHKKCASSRWFPYFGARNGLLESRVGWGREAGREGAWGPSQSSGLSLRLSRSWEGIRKSTVLCHKNIMSPSSTALPMSNITYHPTWIRPKKHDDLCLASAFTLRHWLSLHALWQSA